VEVAAGRGAVSARQEVAAWPATSFEVSSDELVASQLAPGGGGEEEAADLSNPSAPECSRNPKGAR